jgi:hypothetical protein
MEKLARIQREAPAGSQSSCLASIRAALCRLGLVFYPEYGASTTFQKVATVLQDTRRHIAEGNNLYYKNMFAAAQNTRHHIAEGSNLYYKNMLQLYKIHGVT